MDEAMLKSYRDSIADCGCQGIDCNAWSCGNVAELLAEVDRLRAAAAGAREVLEEVQWGDDVGPVSHYCPSCGAWKERPESHAADCRLAAALADLAG